MKSLETSTNAERLLWAAAVHRNTENPHVHIAIQKQYFTKEIERQVLKKIPREALPHYVVRDNEMVLVNGHLIDAATEKMEAIIGRERMHDKAPKRSERGTTFEEGKLAMRIAEERKILARGIVAEYELLRIETRIESLLDRGGIMRFTVSDPVTGRKKRLSLQELQKRDTVLAAAIIAAFTLYFRYSKTGIAMRATASDPLTAYVLGIDVRRTQALTWIFAGIVGAVAGIVVASVTSLSPALGGAALGVLAVIILGGLDSIAGAIVAGLIIGLTESLTAGYLGGKVRDIVPYATVLIILLVRPYGLFGTRQIERL